MSEPCRDDGAPDHQSDSAWETLSNFPALLSVHLYIWLKKSARNPTENHQNHPDLLTRKCSDKKGSGRLLIQRSLPREAPSCEKSTLIYLQTKSPSLEGWLNKAKPESQRWKFTQQSMTDDVLKLLEWQINHFIINLKSRTWNVKTSIQSGLHVTVVLLILISYSIYLVNILNQILQSSGQSRGVKTSRTCHGLFMLMAMTWKR